MSSPRWRVPGLRETGPTLDARSVRVSARLTYVRLPDADARAAFEADARRLLALDDPHLVRWIAWFPGPGGDVAAVLTEDVAGAALSGILARHGPVSADAALVVLRSCLLALAAAGPHPGLSTDNVFVTDAGEVKVAGWEARGAPASSAHDPVRLALACVPGPVRKGPLAALAALDGRDPAEALEALPAVAAQYGRSWQARGTAELSRAVGGLTRRRRRPGRWGLAGCAVGALVLGASAVVVIGGQPERDPSAGATAAPSASVRRSTVPVQSAAGWQATGISATVGETVRIQTEGGAWTVDYRMYPPVGPEGYSPAVDRRISAAADCKVHAGAPYGALLARIGDGPVVPVNRLADLTAEAPGPVRLRVNDGDPCLADNRGVLSVLVFPP
ncbi:hypothetical protein [Actinocorallia herbida]|nr:hypothetical protein [Actinocorallia herbida]